MRSNFINQGDSFFLDCIQDKISHFKIFNPIVDPNCTSGFRSKIKSLSTLLFILVFSVFTTSCNKDSDLLLDQVINKPEIVSIEEEVRTDPTKETIVLTADFQWENIEAKYANTNWEIKEVIDLENKKVTIPQGVIMSFKGGSLKNGTLIGDDTGIVTSSRQRLFDGVNLAGSFSNEFIKPFWFGAIMDGVTDDRNFFVETLAQANQIKAKVLIDADIFLNVEETGEKSIFLEDNTWIEGSSEKIKIITNSKLSPVFIMALSKNVFFKNFTILHDNNYNASFDEANEISNRTANTQALEDYLVANRNIKFNSMNPVWTGPDAYKALIYLAGAEEIVLENIILKANGETANTFIEFGILFKAEFSPNQTVTSILDPKTLTKDITFKNVVLDGTLMGIQGTVQNFSSDGLRSYRYSDTQSEDGSNIGGNTGDDGYFASPPHLIYLNTSNSPESCRDITITNTIDYGKYVGDKSVRNTISGYCNSLKLTDNHNGVYVENYKSYRRDGLADLQNISNGIFKNLYSESNSSIFNPDFKFNALRFLGTLNDVTFENITLKDNAEVSEIYPLDTSDGNMVIMKNINIHLNELRTNSNGCFGINGSNNKVTNSKLVMEKNTSTEDYIGIIAVDNETLSNGSNNYYDVQVEGWRQITNDPSKECVRVILQNSDNQNDNYARVYDLNNDFLTEQINGIKKDIWSRKEILILENGNEQFLEINIPRGFVLKKASAKILENLNTDINLKLSSDFNGSKNFLSGISNTNKFVEKIIDQTSPNNSDHPLLLSADSNFNGIGKVEISIVLERLQTIQ